MTDEQPLDVPSDWWRGFFHGVALDLWRLAISDEQTALDVEFIAKRAGVSPPARILDVPCGNGRIGVELLARGYEVTGVDIAGEFIEEARSKAAARGYAGEWRQGEMRDLPADATFDAVLCWGNSFGYLDNAGNEAFLAAAGGALRPGGRLLLDLPQVAESFFANYHDRRSFEVGDIQFAVRHDYDPQQGRVQTEYTFLRNGKEDRRLGSHRVYATSEICRMLERTGFTVERLFGGPAGEPFEIGSPRLIIVSRRNTG